jgi:iron complex transport system ATP-binding protein
VTHHVEEIPAGITHALLLADGLAVRSGPLDETITGDGPSAAFGMPIKGRTARPPQDGAGEVDDAL